LGRAGARDSGAGGGEKVAESKWIVMRKTSGKSIVTGNTTFGNQFKNSSVPRGAIKGGGKFKGPRLPLLRSTQKKTKN